MSSYIVFFKGGRSNLSVLLLTILIVFLSSCAKVDIDDTSKIVEAPLVPEKPKKEPNSTLELKSNVAIIDFSAFLKVRKGANYGDFKQAVEKQGWAVDSSLGNGVSADFPEILCGEGYDSICSVRFQKDEHEVVALITVNGKYFQYDSAYED